MKTDLAKKLGNIDQLAGVRFERVEGGSAAGSRLLHVWNAAGLSFTVQPDKCLDLYDCSFRGVNLAFHSKNGMTAPGRFLPEASAFFSYWSGGMLATCGLGNVGGADVSDPLDPQPIHGRIGYAAAEALSADAFWQGEDYVLSVSGRMRESRLYGRNLELHRQIRTTLFSREIEITDTVTNLSDAPEPVFLLYHFNFGYPLLDETSRFFGPRSEITPGSSDGERDHLSMHAPVDAAPQQTFLHKPFEQGEVTAGIVNPARKLAAYLRYDTRALPYLLEWKCLKSHDYVLAAEPTNCPANNRETDLRSGSVPVLGAYESLQYHVTLCVAEGDDIPSALNGEE
jgi:hypothetical protein